MYVDTNNTTGYFIYIYIVTILRIVRSESQTSLHSQDILTSDRESREGKDDRDPKYKVETIFKLQM